MSWTLCHVWLFGVVSKGTLVAKRQGTLCDSNGTNLQFEWKVPDARGEDVSTTNQGPGKQVWIQNEIELFWRKLGSPEG